MKANAPNIFVVDDDVSVREAVESLIRSAGFKVQTFCSGHDVWRCVQRELPSCMVLDLDLPPPIWISRLPSRPVNFGAIFFTDSTSFL